MLQAKECILASYFLFKLPSLKLHTTLWYYFLLQLFSVLISLSAHLIITIIIMTMTNGNVRSSIFATPTPVCQYHIVVVCNLCFRCSSRPNSSSSSTLKQYYNLYKSFTKACTQLISIQQQIISLALPGADCLLLYYLLMEMERE